MGFSIALIFSCLLSTPIQEGDGYEYILVLQSFFNHLSPDIRVSDLDGIIELSKNQQGINYNNFYEQIRDAIQNGESHRGLGIFKSNNGAYFGWHFWFYSLINLPAKSLLALLNQNEFKAFQLTNALLMIGAISYTMLLSKQDSIIRIFITLFYLVGCNFLYLKWPHPEVYTASLLLVASCAFLDNRYRFSAFLTALAALQNPSALMFIPLIMLTFIAKSYIAAPKQWLDKSFIWQLMQLGIIGCIALIPYGFYYYHFGVFSLIVESGFVDRSLIGLKRLTSILFDLNQGMIIGFPGIMLSIGILFCFRLWRCLKSKKQQIFAWCDVLILATLVMLIPVLGQTNWNAGQEVFNRYAFWSSMPLLVWAAINLRMLKLSRLTQFSMLIVILLLQLVPHIFFLKHSWSKVIYLKPTAKWVLENLPGWYKPEPEIFAERVQGREGYSKKEAPYVYISQKGYMRQILLAENFTNEIDKKICGASLVNSKTGSPIDLSKVSFDQQGWGYLIGDFSCSLPITINFNQAGNSRHFIGSGWSTPEKNGTWTEGSKARIRIPIVSANLSDLRLIVKLAPFVNSSHPQQDVDVIVNGEVIAHWRFINGNTRNERQLIIPQKLAKQQFPLQISLKMLTPVSPFQLGLSKDKIQLGIKMLELRLDYANKKNQKQKSKES